MTSNIGSRRIIAAKGDRQVAVDGVMEELDETLKPEFLNRIDDVIVFDALTRNDMDAIFQIQMRRVAKLLTSRSLLIEVSPDAATLLMTPALTPDFGARPLKRAIQQYLLNPMSRAIVSGNYTVGDTVKVDVDGEHIEFSRVPAPIDETAQSADST